MDCLNATDAPAPNWPAHGEAALDLFDSLHRLADQSPSSPLVGTLLLELIKSVDQHLAKEDYLLISGRCQSSRRHREMHGQLMQHLTDIIHEYEVGRTATLIADIGCIATLFAQHVHASRVCPHATNCRGCYPAA